MNILLVRTSALGDIVHCLPVLRALRRQHADARIGWVAEAAFAPLLAGHRDLDEVIEIRLRDWRTQPTSPRVWREVRALRSTLRAFRADLALDLMGNHKGALLSALSGAKRTLGAARRHRREPSSALWLRETVEAPGPHAVDRALDLVHGLGLPREPADFGGERLLPDASASAEPDAEALLCTGKPFILIQAGAGWGNKQYPPAWWGQVARALHTATGLAIRVPIAPGEAHLAEAVARASRGVAIPVAAKGLDVLVALLRRCRLLLGGDTGPLHLAHALDTPVLCLMGPTDPRRNGPYGADHQALWHQLPCSFCYKRFADAKACLLAPTPEAVVARAQSILEASAPTDEIDLRRERGIDE